MPRDVLRKLDFQVATIADLNGMTKKAILADPYLLPDGDRIKLYGLVDRIRSLDLRARPVLRLIKGGE